MPDRERLPEHAETQVDPRSFHYRLRGLTPLRKNTCPVGHYCSGVLVLLRAQAELSALLRHRLRCQAITVQLISTP